MSKEIEINKDIITGKIEVKDVLIKIERDSVSFGDDSTAPHYKEMFFNKTDLLSDLFKKIILNTYIPNIADCTWNICCQNKVLGQIYFDSDRKESYKIFIPDDSIALLNGKNIYCKKEQN